MKKTYLALITLLVTTLSFADQTGSFGIGYPSYEAALAAVRADPAVNIGEDQGWIVAENNAEKSLWSFSPEGHPAHPAVFKRNILTDSGKVYIEMQVLCGGPKEQCDQLVQEFVQLNEAISESMNNGK